MTTEVIFFQTVRFQPFIVNETMVRSQTKKKERKKKKIITKQLGSFVLVMICKKMRALMGTCWLNERYL